MRRILSMFIVCNLFGNALHAQLSLIDQSTEQVGASVIAQHFEPAYGAYTSYAAEDFSVGSGQQWHIDSVLLFGEYVVSTGTPVPGSGLILSIYTDIGGLPGTLVFSDTLPVGADPDEDGSLRMAWSNPLVLSPGNYWMVAASRKDFSPDLTQWQWFSSDSTIGDTGLWQNPGEGFTLIDCPSWTEVTTCYGSIHPGLSFLMMGCPGAPPDIQGLPADTSFCTGQELSLFVSTNAAIPNYTWSNGQNGATLVTDSGGIFQLVVTDSATGCASEASVNILALESPQVQLENDSFCYGDTILLQAYVCGQCNYLWNDGYTGSQVFADTTGLYTVMIVDTLSGCYVTDSSQLILWAIDTLKVYPEGSILEFCANEGIALWVDQLYDDYQWSDGSDGFQSVFNETAEVGITVSDVHGCEQSAGKQILALPEPEPVIVVSFVGGSFLLYGGEYESYMWSDGSTNDSVYISNGNPEIILWVTDSNSCTGSDTVFLPLGIEKQEQKDGIKLAPNPVVDFLHINRAPSGSEIQIFGMDGKLNYKEVLNETSVSIDLSTLTKGTYLCNIRYGTFNFTKILIKQ